MNGQVYQATPEQVSKWIDLKAMPWVEASRPLLVGLYKGECKCILGAVPTSIISNDVAYLWLWTPPAVPKIVFGRHAKHVIKKLLSIYPTLLCDCHFEDSARWLLSLGAKHVRSTLYVFRRP